MSLTALSGVNYDNFTTPTISSSLSDGSDSLIINSDDNKSAFSALFDSAVKMVNETNDYSNAAEEEEIKYALGESDSIHDLQIAQQKANDFVTIYGCRKKRFCSGIQRIDEFTILK